MISEKLFALVTSSAFVTKEKKIAYQFNALYTNVVDVLASSLSTTSTSFNSYFIG